jgi:hypothetical protein
MSFVANWRSFSPIGVFHWSETLHETGLIIIEKRQRQENYLHTTLDFIAISLTIIFKIKLL